MSGLDIADESLGVTIVRYTITDSELSELAHTTGLFLSREGT